MAEPDRPAPGEAAAPNGEPTAPKPRPRNPVSARNVSFLKGKLTVDTYAHPVLGSRDAPHVVVELMDYACSHCREFAEMLEQARPRYGDQLAIVVMPVPSELLCNKYVKRSRPQARGVCKLTRASLALAEVAPDRFSELHHWVLAADSLRPWGTVLRRAREMGGDEAVQNAFLGEAIKRRVQQNIELYATIARSGAKSLPCQILGDKVAPGKPTSVESLCRLWEETLGVVPVETP